MPSRRIFAHYRVLPAVEIAPFLFMAAESRDQIV